MKYEILFEAPGCGVWALHESQESAEKHVKLLRTMVPSNFRWSIFHQGEEIKSSRKKVETKEKA